MRHAQAVLCKQYEEQLLCNRHGGVTGTSVYLKAVLAYLEPAAALLDSAAVHSQLHLLLDALLLCSHPCACSKATDHRANKAGCELQLSPAAPQPAFVCCRLQLLCGTLDSPQAQLLVCVRQLLLRDILTASSCILKVYTDVNLHTVRWAPLGNSA